jgi:hypothetical protein
MSNVIIYTRTSSKGTFKSSKSRQELSCSTHATTLGLTVTHIFNDLAVDNIPLSERNGWLNLIGSLSNVEPNESTILVESLSRLSRNNEILKEVRDLAIKTSTNIISLDGLDLKKMSDDTLQIVSLVLIAEKQNVLNKIKNAATLVKSKRVRVTINNEGKFYGQDNIFEKHKTQLLAYYNQLVKRGVSPTLSQKQQDLYQLGIKTKFGTPISQSSILRIEKLAWLQANRNDDGPTVQ